MATHSVKITARSGAYSSEVDLNVIDWGTVPTPPPVIVPPTASSINGITITGTFAVVPGVCPFLTASDFSVLPSASLTGGLKIIGTHLDSVTGIQLDFGGVFTDANAEIYNPWPFDGVNLNASYYTGSVVAPDGWDIAALSWSLTGTTEINISAEQIASTAIGRFPLTGSTFSSFPNPFQGTPYVGTGFQSIAEWMGQDFVNQINGGVGRSLTVSDVWWKLRLHYGKSHVSPEFYIQFMGPDYITFTPAPDIDLASIKVLVGETIKVDAYVGLNDVDYTSSVLISGNPAIWDQGYFYTYATAFSITPDGYMTGISAGTDSLWYDWARISAGTLAQVTVVQPPPGGISAFLISGNPSYLTSSASTYLEAYPMWTGTNAATYMTASTATPNPPKTGHGVFAYNSTTGIVNVSSSASAYRWDGNWNPDLNNASNTSPWAYPVYAMNTPGKHFLTKGYAGASYSGSTTNDGVNWIPLADVGYLDPKFKATAATGLSAFSTGTNYYAQTLTAEFDAVTNTTTVYQIDMTSGGTTVNRTRAGRIIHLVAYGTQTGSFANAASIRLETTLYTDNSIATGSQDMKFKKLSNDELLVWLPTNIMNDGAGNPINDPTWPEFADLYRDVNFVFTNNDTSTFSVTIGKTFNGV